MEISLKHPLHTLAIDMSVGKILRSKQNDEKDSHPKNSEKLHTKFRITYFTLSGSLCCRFFVCVWCSRVFTKLFDIFAEIKRGNCSEIAIFNLRQPQMLSQVIAKKLKLSTPLQYFSHCNTKQL